MGKATLKGLLAHKFRLAATALAIVLGVSFVAGTFVLTDTINASFDDLFTQVTQGIDVAVRSKETFGGFEHRRGPRPHAGRPARRDQGGRRRPGGRGHASPATPSSSARTARR